MTAVTRLLEYFIEQNDNGATHWSVQDLIAQLHQAKEMEKEQIMDAYSEGDVNGIMDNEIRAEQYYNETFKSE